MSPDKIKNGASQNVHSEYAQSYEPKIDAHAPRFGTKARVRRTEALKGETAIRLTAKEVEPKQVVLDDAAGDDDDERQPQQERVVEEVDYVAGDRGGRVRDETNEEGEESDRDQDGRGGGARKPRVAAARAVRGGTGADVDEVVLAVVEAACAEEAVAGDVVDARGHVPAVEGHGGDEDGTGEEGDEARAEEDGFGALFCRLNLRWFSWHEF